MTKTMLSVFIACVGLLGACGRKAEPAQDHKGHVKPPRLSNPKVVSRPNSNTAGQKENPDGAGSLTGTGGEISREPVALGTGEAALLHGRQLKESLVSACTRAAGHWEDAEVRCVCPDFDDNVAFTPEKMFSTTDEGFACVSAAAENYGVKFLHQFEAPKDAHFSNLLAKEGAAAFKIAVQSNLFYRRRSQILISIGAEFDTPSGLDSIAKALDELNLRDTHISVPSGVGRMVTTQIVIGHPAYLDATGAPAKDSVLRPAILDAIDPNTALKYSIYLANPHDLRAALGDRRHRKLANGPRVLPADASPSLTLAHAYINYSNRHNTTFTLVSGTAAEGDCLVACDLVHEASLTNQPDSARYLRTDSYVRGVRVSSRIDVKDRKSGNPRAIVMMHHSDQPTLVVTLDEDLTTGKVIERWFDGYYKGLGAAVEHDRIKDLSTLTNEARNWRTDFDPANETAIVTYEESFSPTDAKVTESIWRGPFSAENPSNAGSLMGWFRNPTSSNFFTFVTGVLEYDADIGTSRREDTEHGDGVNQLLLTSTPANKTIRLVPLGHAFVTSVEESVFDELRNRMGGHPFIVNFSMFSTQSPESCKAAVGDTFRTLPALLVAGAGNHGLAVEGNRTFKCPQNLKDMDNLLIVSWLKNGSLSQYADYGSRYADIAADGTSPLGDVGSSFSAPRVSNVAARIALTQPSLDATQIRLAILAGAKVNTAAPLPVRSGGELDADGAFDFAQRLASSGIGKGGRVQFESLKTLMASRYGASEAQARLRLLIDNVAIHE